MYTVGYPTLVKNFVARVTAAASEVDPPAGLVPKPKPMPSPVPPAPTPTPVQS